MKRDLITILGPTAVGKTRLAALLANEFNGEIISADSRQVYKGMDIGTGKDIKDYSVNGKNIPYHLIDIENPENEYNLLRFITDSSEAFRKITADNKLPFLAGGTGLYLDAILNRYKLSRVEFDDSKINELRRNSLEQLKAKLLSVKPRQHNTTDLSDKERIIKSILIAETPPSMIVRFPKHRPLVIGIFEERGKVKKRITERLRKRLSSGMIEEVKNLLESGITEERLELFGLEYKFVAKFIAGELNYNDMFQKLNSAIHNFAKRQMTWFRKMEKTGINIHRIEGRNFDAAKNLITRFLTDGNNIH